MSFFYFASCWRAESFQQQHKNRKERVEQSVEKKKKMKVTVARCG
jgi:hypothetical protein